MKTKLIAFFGVFFLLMILACEAEGPRRTTPPKPTKTERVKTENKKACEWSRNQRSECREYQK